MKQPSADPKVADPAMGRVDLAAGRPEAFASLYDRLGGALLRVAAAMLRDRGDAEDAIQDLFVNLVRHRAGLAGVEDLDAYVFTILRNIVYGKLREQQTEQRRLREFAASRQPAESVEHDEQIERALASLPPEQREAVTLKIDGGLTFAQIGSVLNVSANTAAGRYRYAMEKLRDRLEPQS